MGTITRFTVEVNSKNKTKALELKNRMQNDDFCGTLTNDAMGESFEIVGARPEKSVDYDEDDVENVLYESITEKYRYLLANRKKIIFTDLVEIEKIPYIVIINKNDTVNLYSSSTRKYYFEDDLNDLEEINQHLTDNDIKYYILENSIYPV